MKKLIAILATVSLFALGNGVAFAGDGAGSYQYQYQTMPNMQQPTYYSNPSSSMQQPTYPSPSYPSSTNVPTSSTYSSGQSTTTTTTTTPMQQTMVGVIIQNFAFMQSTVTVPVGTKVTWTNQDNVAHTVTGNTSGGPSSGTLQPGQSYSFTFTSAGTYPYHCSIHPMMMGTVVVTGASSPPTSAVTTPPSNPTPTSAPPTTTPTTTQMAPTSLPNTGAGSALAVFGIATVLGAIGYFLHLHRKVTGR